LTTHSQSMAASGPFCCCSARIHKSSPPFSLFPRLRRLVLCGPRSRAKARHKFDAKSAQQHNQPQFNQILTAHNTRPESVVNFRGVYRISLPAASTGDVFANGPIEADLANSLCCWAGVVIGSCAGSCWRGCEFRSICFLILKAILF
jgi:hypothetical protein